MSIDSWSASISTVEEISQESDYVAQAKDAADFYQAIHHQAIASDSAHFSSKKSIIRPNLTQVHNYFEVYSPPPENC